MTDAYVFRYRPPAVPELLYFDGQELVPLTTPHWLHLPVGLSPAWGVKTVGATLTAYLLCAHCAVPQELIESVASLLRAEWVVQLPKGPHSMPGWMVRQEVLRVCVRVLNSIHEK